MIPEPGVARLWCFGDSWPSFFEAARVSKRVLSNRQSATSQRASSGVSSLVAIEKEKDIDASAYLCYILERETRIEYDDEWDELLPVNPTVTCSVGVNERVLSVLPLRPSLWEPGHATSNV